MIEIKVENKKELYQVYFMLWSDSKTGKKIFGLENGIEALYNDIIQIDKTLLKSDTEAIKQAKRHNADIIVIERSDK